MTFIYIQTLKVPTWAVMKTKHKRKEVIGFFENNGGEYIEFNPRRFKEIIHSYKNNGYYNVFMEKELQLPQQLTDRAFVDFMREFSSPNVVLSPVNSYGINRNITCDDDYTKILMHMLQLQSNIILSQAFQVGEKCHDTSNKIRPTLFISDDLGSIPQRLSDKIVTIGDDTCDIDISGIKGKGSLELISDTITKYFVDKSEEEVVY